jgi:hypothetical protein
MRQSSGALALARLSFRGGGVSRIGLQPPGSFAAVAFVDANVSAENTRRRAIAQRGGPVSVYASGEFRTQTLRQSPQRKIRNGSGAGAR